MNTKLLLFLACVLLTILTGQAAFAARSAAAARPADVGSWQPVREPHSAIANTKAAPRGAAVFRSEKDVQGLQRYILRLADPPVASYRGGVPGLRPTDARYVHAQRGLAGAPRLDTASPASKAYAGYLAARQRTFLASADRQLGRSIRQTHSYVYTFNGIVLEMTQDEAREVARLPGVVSIRRDVARPLTTDRGPRFIGAGAVWDGSATNSSGTLGEGIVVGVLDSGINGDHPSFAEVGGDGYVHVNPLGDGVYLGECFRTPEIHCNSKLIGRYDFTASGSSEDSDGHGSHTASTAVGNVLHGPPVPDAEGQPLDYTLGTISGVAPHANLVAYKVCPGTTCDDSAILDALDQAVIDGVDVINYSISSGSGSPWNDTTGQAFKGLRAAGISAANSAGNSGIDEDFNYVDGAAGATAGAPWSSSIAASSHDRILIEKSISFTGAAGAPDPISGRAITAAYTGPIVYAGDYTNDQFPDLDPAQCLEPFPAGTFNGDEIVVCDRGAIARVQKAINVRDGGAAGFVLCNVDDGAQWLADDPHVIPGIHIHAAECNGLRAWLATGNGHQATIEATPPPQTDAGVADVMAAFSSRGPYQGFDILVPTLSAPGLEIFAAVADPQQFEFLQGTSMSSPHVAGAMALLHAAHPDWTPAEVHAALVTTGQTEIREEIDPSIYPPGPLRPADAFDYGGGRVQLEYAAAAGLLLDEIDANFEAADPALGGDPRRLNMPYLYDRECLGRCSWTRTVRATQPGTWTVHGMSPDGIVLSAEPASFTLAAGDTREIEFSADVRGLDPGHWAFGGATLSHDAGAPEQTLPVVLRVAPSIVPDSIAVTADRDAGSWPGGGLLLAETDGLRATAYGLTVPNRHTLEIAGSSGTPYEDVATETFFYTVPAGTLVLTAETLSSTAPDVDLYVGEDTNHDGDIAPDEELCSSTSPASLERCELSAEQLADGGHFWVAVHNWNGSGDDVVDTTALEVTVISPPMAGDIDVELPDSPQALEPFDVRIFWNHPMEIGQTYVGAIVLSTPDTSLGTVPVEITRIDNDVLAYPSADSVQVGDIVTVTVELAANMSRDHRGYVVDARLPSGLELVSGSVSGGDQSFVFNDSVIWLVDRPSLTLIGRNYHPSVNGPGVDPDHPLFDPLCDTGHGGYIDFAGVGLRPHAAIHGNEVVFDVLTGQTFTHFGDERLGVAHVTDDGFVFFNSHSGAAPGSNVAIPNAAAPNDMLAVLWTDMEIVYDAGSGSGVTTATAGSFESAIEWDDMQRAPAGAGSDRIDFQVVLDARVDDTPGNYEVVYAYDNLIGDWSDATIGIENLDGSKGTQFHGDLSDGMMICWDYRMDPADPAVLSFRARVMPSASGSTVEQPVHHIVDAPGSVEVVEIVRMSVAASDSDADGVMDADDNCAMAPNPKQRDTDGDGFGNRCDADFDQDGHVGLTDLHYMIEAYGSETGNPHADLDGSGGIDYGDIRIFKNLWLRPPGPSGHH